MIAFSLFIITAVGKSLYVYTTVYPFTVDEGLNCFQLLGIAALCVLGCEPWGTCACFSEVYITPGEIMGLKRSVYFVHRR